MSSEILTIIAALQPTVTPPLRERRAGCGGCATASGARSAAGTAAGSWTGTIGNRSPRCDVERAHTAAERLWREAYINAQARLGVF